jgi:hypothetical protein
MANPIPKRRLGVTISLRRRPIRLAWWHGSGRAAIWTSLGGCGRERPGSHLRSVRRRGWSRSQVMSPAQGRSRSLLSSRVRQAGWQQEWRHARAAQAGANLRYAAWSSPDGRTWFRQPWQAGPVGISALASNPASYVAVNPEGLWFSGRWGRPWLARSGSDPRTGGWSVSPPPYGQYLAVRTEPSERRRRVSSATVSTGMSCSPCPATWPAQFRRTAGSGGKWALVGSRGDSGP